ncbi:MULTISPECIES: hypothetical protein [Liquorilactobacillus]|uniref:hypothetical protein n=1 Tax=Liquorilactobacillus TaxID=2767888 RepID=UPI001CBF1B70|nr:hypothetical protein [Liquorilactobacillus hordei]MBZ2406646.1 hypothetical protein [Liquorilactobacillus hordei]
MHFRAFTRFGVFNEEQQEEQQKENTNNQDKLAIIENFFHLLNLKISDELLENPTEKNIKKAKETLSVIDSNSFMLYPNWYQNKSMKDVENILETLEKSLKERI